MSTIQSMAARARRECDTNGLPAGEYNYSDPLKIENRYQSEGGAIREQYGTIANWNAWECVTVRERATGRRVFDNEVAKITCSTPPAAGVVITADYEYYIQVRFDDDKLSKELVQFKLYNTGLKFKEVLWNIYTAP